MRFAPLVPKPKPFNSGERKPQAPPFTRSHVASEAQLHDSWEAAANGLGDFTTATWNHGLPAGIMAKLEVGGVHDPLEHEADAIADRVMRMPAPSRGVSVGLAPAPEPNTDLDADVETQDEALSEAPPVAAFAGAAALPGGPGSVAQRKCASCEPEEEDEIRRSVVAELLMRECQTCEDEGEIRRACASCDVGDTDDLVLRRARPFEVHLDAPSSRRHVLRGRELAAGARGGPTSEAFTTRVHHLQHSGGRPLSASARSFLEPRMGVELSGVRVHADAEAGRLARQINARAFTLAQHVFFAPGELRPHSSAGMHLLAHEVAHTLQNTRKVEPLRRAPTKEQAALDAAIENADHGSDLLEQDPKLIAQVDKLRSQLMLVIDDLVVPNQAEGIPSALEDFGVPASLRKKTDASAQRFYKITRYLETRETVESVLMSQWLDAAIEIIDLLSECLRHVVTHDAPVGKVFEAEYGKTLKSLKSLTKTLREHKFFKEGAEIETKLKPLEQAKAKADRAAEIQRQLALVRQEMSAYWNWQPLKDIQAEHARLSAKLFAMGGRSATGVLEVQVEVLAGLLGLRDEDESKLNFLDKDVEKEHYAYIQDAEGEQLSQLDVHDLESLGMAALDGLSAIAESTKRIDAAVTGVREAIQAGRPYDLTTLKLRELLAVERQLWRQVEASPPGDPLAEQLRAFLTGDIQNYRQHRAARVAEGQRRESMSTEELGRTTAMSGVLAQLAAGWELGTRVPVDLQSLTHWELAELRVQIDARLQDPHDTRHRAELRALRDELETSFVEKRQDYIANRRHEIIPDDDAALQSALKTFSAANSKAALQLEARQRFPLDLDQLELALEFGRMSADELDLAGQLMTDELSQLGARIANGEADDDYHRGRYERLYEITEELGHRIDIQLMIGDPDPKSSGSNAIYNAASRFAFGQDLYELKRNNYSQAFRTTSLDDLAVDHPELVEMIHDCAALTDELFATVLDGTALTGVPRDDARLFLLNEYMEDLALINQGMDVDAVAPDTIRAWMKSANMLAREFDALTQWLKYPTDNPWRALGRKTVAKSQAVLDHQFMRMVQVVADEQSARDARAQNIERIANWLILRVELDHDEFKKVIRNPILGPNKGAQTAHAIIARLKSYKLATSDLPTIFSLAKRKDTSYFLLAMSRGHTVRVLQEQYGAQHLLAFVDEADFATMLTISENEGLMASGTEEMDYSMTDVLECAAGFLVGIVPGLWHALESIPEAIKVLLQAETWAKVYDFLTDKVPQFVADEDFRMKVGKSLGAATAQIIAQLREMSPYEFGEKLADFVAPMLLELILTALTAGAAQGLKLKYATRFEAAGAKVDNIVDELLGAFSWKMVELGIRARGAQKYLDTMETLAAVRSRIGKTLEAISDGLDSLSFGTQTARFARENAAQRQAVRALEKVDLELAELGGRWASNQIDKVEFADQLAKLERRAEIAERRLFPDGNPMLESESHQLSLRGGGKAGYAHDWDEMPEAQIRALRLELLETADLDDVLRNLNGSGFTMDPKHLAGIKKYLFDSPGIAFTRENYDAWQRLAGRSKDRATLRDVEFLMHESAEVTRLEAVRARTGFDFVGERWSSMSPLDRDRWRKSWDLQVGEGADAVIVGHYISAHGHALEAQYNWLANLMNSRYGTDIDGRIAAAIDKSMTGREAKMYMQADDLPLGMHPDFSSWKGQANDVIELDMRQRTELGIALNLGVHEVGGYARFTEVVRNGGNPTIAELLAAVRRSTI